MINNCNILNNGKYFAENGSQIIYHCNYSLDILHLKLIKLVHDSQKNFFLIGIYPMQGLTATTRHGVTRKKAQKRFQDIGNLFRKNLQLKDVC